jgi:hypothetical protein
LHDKELHNLYSSPNIIRMIKSWMVTWTGWGEKRNTYKVQMGKPEGNRPVGNLDVDEWIILKLF